MERNNKSKLVVMSLTLAMTLTNCATQVNNTANIPKTGNAITDVITNNSINKINGTAHFPDKVNPAINLSSINPNQFKNRQDKYRFQNRAFGTKALVSDVVAQATVSLIYPADYTNASLRNVTIATGLTNASGQFSISTGSFTPVVGTVYVLEAVKRLGGAGNYVITLRTHVRWTGTVWQSMTTPGIDLDLVTTALAIISSLNPQDLPSADPIGKVPVSGGLAAVNDINGKVTASLVNSVIALENQVLNENQDPFAAIYFSGGQYLFRHTVSVANDTVVNTFTTGAQNNQAIAMDSAGDFVVTWDSNNQDGSAYGIFAQRYNYAGRALGSEFQVNTYTTNTQRNPAIAMDNAGDFVISWSGEGSGDSYGIFAQRYDSSGAKVGSEFRINTFTTGNQINPAIGMDSKGDFVVSWESYNQDGDSYGIYAQRYGSTGLAAGSEFKVNTFTASFQINPTVAMDRTGNFVITWASGGSSNNGPDGASYGISAQRYNASGVAQGSEFQVNTFTTGNQEVPVIAMDSAGDFVIAWESNNQDGSNYGIYAQRYNKSGTKAGSEFQVNTFTTNSQESPAIAMDSNGDFVISWASGKYNGTTQDGSLYGIYAQRYNNSGAKVGSEFQVNTFTNGNQVSPAAAMDSAGDFVIAWQSKYQDGSNFAVIEKRYNSFGIPQP